MVKLRSQFRTCRPCAYNSDVNFIFVHAILINLKQLI